MVVLFAFVAAPKTSLRPVIMMMSPPEKRTTTTDDASHANRNANRGNKAVSTDDNEKTKSTDPNLSDNIDYQKQVSSTLHDEENEDDGDEDNIYVDDGSDDDHEIGNDKDAGRDDDDIGSEYSTDEEGKKAASQTTTSTDDRRTASVGRPALRRTAGQQQARRAKRLAMNRASARERRRRKKVLLETLETRVNELKAQVLTLKDVNTDLQSHVRKLEAELAGAHGVIATLSTKIIASASTTGVPAAAGGPTDASQASAVPHESSRIAPSRSVTPAVRGGRVAANGLDGTTQASELRSVLLGRATDSIPTAGTAATRVSTLQPSTIGRPSVAELSDRVMSSSAFGMADPTFRSLLLQLQVEQQRSSQVTAAASNSASSAPRSVLAGSIPGASPAPSLNPLLGRLGYATNVGGVGNNNAAVSSSRLISSSCIELFSQHYCCQPRWNGGTRTAP